MRKAEYVFIFLIALTASLILFHFAQVNNSPGAANSLAQGINNTAAYSTQTADPSGSLVSQNEIVQSSDTENSNFWFNSRFLPGKVVYVNGLYECEAAVSITTPHICFLPLFNIGAPVFFFCGGSNNLANVSNVVGYLGFPQSEGSDLSALGALVTHEYFPNLASGVFQPLHIFEPSSGFPYQNFFNFSNSAIKEYSGGLSGYYYAINNSYIGNQIGSATTVPKSTLIIPSISCGSTFPYNSLVLPGANVPSIPTLTGFTPSVFLASNTQDGVGEYYLGGELTGSSVWTKKSGSLAFNPVYAYQVQNIAPVFNYTSPTSGYAKFPSGNKGDLNYINKTLPFYTAVPLDYFGTDTNGFVLLFSGNNTISSGQEIINVNGVIQDTSVIDGLPLEKIDSYTLPNLQAVYYPSLISMYYGAGLVDPTQHEEFATDGFFPFCESGGQITENCTFEDSPSINPISSERLWESAYLPSSNLANQPTTPGYDSSAPLNNFTLEALDSFCFYGQSFNTRTGTYTPPSYTRIIAPTAAENYTAAVATCNSFYNSTNCFSTTYNNDLNFGEGTVVSDISCTNSGITGNITDAWIRSLYVSNNGGSYCGDFLGEKNLSNPSANSTLFLQESYNCPEFNSNSSTVPVVVTVKNVGTTTITNPYFIALFRDNNVSQMFYTSPSQNQVENYGLFQQMLSGIREQGMTGVIGLTYNSSFDTNLYIYKERYPLNPIPIQSLFSASSDYENGPYNNSLLGMWFYRPGTGGSDNVTRTSNTFLVDSNSNGSGVPAIAPNGTATFTVEVPMGLFEELLQGKYLASFYFGNLFNVSWNGDPTPISKMGNMQVNPLPQSGEGQINTLQPNSNFHNNEVLSSSSSSPSAPWQYLVSYNVNFSKAPFSNITIFNDKFNFSVSATNSTAAAILVNANSDVSVLNGSGTYKLSGSALTGSSISCFASQDNINDFSVFWSKQIVSPANLDYAIKNSYDANSTVNGVLITRWRGLLFMPYSDQVALNLNNLPNYASSVVSFMLQQPEVKSTSSISQEEAVAYFGSGSLSSSFNELSSVYNNLNSTYIPVPSVLSPTAYGFTLTANNLFGNGSLLRIIGSRSVSNISVFSNKNILLDIINSSSETRFIATTNGSGIFSSNPSFSSVLDSLQVNKSYIQVLSKSGPFQVDMFNNSVLNMSNENSNGTYLVSGNFSLSTPDPSFPGFYTTILNVSKTLKHGFSLVFTPEPLTTILKGADMYLYNINGSPFNCNIVNNYQQALSNIGAAQIGEGEYYLPNGAIICDLHSAFNTLRAVFINSTNKAYLGSGDINLKFSIQNLSSKSLYLTYDGAPLNSQDLNLSGNSCSAVNQVVNNGILNYSGGCSLDNETISFRYYSGGAAGLFSAILPSVVNNTPPGGFIMLDPSGLSDNPSSAAEINVSSAYNIPVIFSINDLFSCNSIKVLSNSSYPYGEVPFQVISSNNGYCSYAFIGSSKASPYTIFIGTPPAPAYPSSWVNYTETPYSVDFKTTDYSGQLLGTCANGIGPCISDFKLGSSGVGSLLVNNVSASSPSISGESLGPVTDCFNVQYSASQSAIFTYSGFGDIHYSENKAYQSTAPSESVTSTYCLFDNSSVISDLLQLSGQPLSINVSNDLYSNFSTVETNNKKVYSVPGPVDVGYSGYNNVNVSNNTYVNYNSLNSDTISYSCSNYSLISTPLPNKTAALPPSDFTPGVSAPYCVANISRSYTQQTSFTDAQNSFNVDGESVGLEFKPGNLTSPSGSIEYDSCDFLSDETTQKAQMLVNGNLVDFNPSNAGENFTANHVANFSGFPLIIDSSNSVYINSCPTNSTIVSYSLCTNPNVEIIPQGGSYSGIEALPVNNGGNLTIGLNISLGGGCFIGNLNGISYSCAPTDGSLAYSASSSASSASTSVSESQYLYNSSAAPTTPVSASFTCSGWADIASGSSTTNESLSCSYPSSTSSGYCSASLSTVQDSSGKYSVIGQCSISVSSSQKIDSDNISINSFKITSQQSESTGISSNFLCGNLTNVISSNNVPAGWTWNAFTTKHTTNPNGIPEVGGCEAGRNSYEVARPNISTTLNTATGSFVQSYSCSSGYSGSILSCSSPVSVGVNKISPGLCSSSTPSEKVVTTTKSVNGTNLGGTPKGCNSFSSPNYSAPTIAGDCISYHTPVFTLQNASYALQYSNSTGKSIGLAIINQKAPAAISIPSSQNLYSTKADYITSLSVSQQEALNLVTQLYPTDLLLSNSLSSALQASSIFSYDLLNVLMLQNPYFGLSGIPGFVNGSVLDYAMSIFTGGTSNNCVSSPLQGNYGIFKLGEGELCSGSSLPKGYSNGVYLSLGSLNEGLHSIQFYSVSHDTSASTPTVNLVDSVGTATNLDSSCSNGNSRVFSSSFSGSKASVNITSDEGCNPINNQLYGYIVNCMYQSPENQTYSVQSQYYLAYNLPTIWNVSYTLLVSPKSYGVIPIPVYDVGVSNGSILSLFPPPPTTFVESGLPGRYTWRVTYDNITKVSNQSTITFSLGAGTYKFSVSTLSNSTANPSCTTTYSPSPSSGSAVSGSETGIVFTSSTSCTSTFFEQGLYSPIFTPSTSVQSGISTSPPTQFFLYAWTITYDGIQQKSYLPYMNFQTAPGTYQFSASDVGLFSVVSSCYYFSPTPSAGKLTAGDSQIITFSSESDCPQTTTFYERGLPSSTEWNITMNGVTSASTSSSISFSDVPGIYSYEAYNTTAINSTGWKCTYVPSPSKGTATSGDFYTITYSATNCVQRLKTTFIQTTSISPWGVTYDGISKQSSSNNVTFYVFPGDYSFSVSTEYEYGGECNGIANSVSVYKETPTPSSGLLKAGGSQSVSYSSSFFLCSIK